MQLPNQLRQQVELANKHYSELQNPDSAAAAEPAQQPAAEPDPAQSTTPAEPETQGAQPAEPEAQPAQQQPQQDLAYWQNRFGILQGKYNAEVPALNAKVRELEVALTDARKASAPAAAPTAQQALDKIASLTDEQLAEFGPDTVAMVETLIARRIGQAAPAQPDTEMVKKLERLEQAEQRRDEERQQDAEARFWASVQAGIPNLHAVNADANFHQWLAKFDPMTGINRQQALASAQSAWDAERVVAIFNTYLTETGQMSTKKREVPPDQVQPAQSRSTTTAATEEKVWLGSEITQFYNDKARGRYSHEEATRIEADIFAATKAGRVR